MEFDVENYDKKLRIDSGSIDIEKPIDGFHYLGYAWGNYNYSDDKKNF